MVGPWPGSIAVVGSLVNIDAKRRRTYAGEEAWFPLLRDLGMRRLRGALMACGLSAVVAGNVVWWLDDQATLDRHFEHKSGVRYRDILGELDPEEVRRAARTIPG